MNEIDFALVEETRPPIYTAMKYWGKKPHNIWREYIQNYTPEDGVYLDPFAGSAISAFEAVKAGRKVCAFDLNPLTAFLIETFCSEFDLNVFTSKVQEIIGEVKLISTYQKFFSTVCRNCGNPHAVAQHFKWDNNLIYEVGIECSNCDDQHKKYLAKPDDTDLLTAGRISTISISEWFPGDVFHESPSFSASFIEGIGGNQFADIWTRRNLFVLSELFSRISRIEDLVLRRHLLLGFVKSVHLCSKMCVPRRPDANRPFSTSWGRSAYLCAKRQMEMNPLLLFEGSCFGKQSVESSMTEFKEYVGRIPKIVYVDKSNRSKKLKNFDIKYGIVNINTIEDYFEPESIDFIMTDPPYGGLVQYLDLSAIWLIWLKRIDPRFEPDFGSEITIKKNILELDAYKVRFQSAIRSLHNILKKDGKIVFTFHNKDIMIWNAFLNALSLGGFKIEKVIHQQNRRSGESNVANPYGTSASDFYIRCVKKPTVNVRTSLEEFEYFVIEKAIRLIALRNEPTPYQILFNGLLAEISSAGFNLENFDKKIEGILSAKVGKVFKIEDGQTAAGKLFWFTDPTEFIKHPDKKLIDRVDESVFGFLRRKGSVNFDEVLGEIFVTYPNGLTPDIRSVKQVLEKYANQSGGKWVYKGGPIEKEFTEHTENLFILSKIGQNMSFKIFIGKREQPEMYKGKTLRSYADYNNLGFLGLDNEVQRRVEMIDMLWIKDNKIELAIEVENSTNFTSGIQRASNLGTQVQKLMVLPDHRAAEFMRINDPLFIDAFQKYRWGYFFYSDLNSFEPATRIRKSDFFDQLKKR